MSQWFMLTLVGRDRPGIVAAVTAVLYRAGCHLGEASMIRLGGNFTIMLMLRTEQEADSLRGELAPVVGELELRLHLDPIPGELHRQQIPDARISVHGADRAGIVAEVTGALAEAGFNILELESDVAGDWKQPFYVMHIEGKALAGMESLQKALAALQATWGGAIQIHLSPIETEIL